MGVIDPTNKSVLELKGLHLYHAGVSNCSMSVRMVLEEKGLPWTSHHLNILRKEHITPEYFGINPNGLVPTLVHDGKVIIESDDICNYLEDQFPDPPLRPADEAGRKAAGDWLRHAVEIHLSAIKPYHYYKAVGKSMAHSQEEVDKYRRLQKNPDLLEFHRKSTETGFSEADIAKAKGTIDECFAEIDAVLSNRDWLVGDAFSLADIAWVPLQFTLENLAGYSFSELPNVSDWSKRLSARKSYQDAIVEWWPFELNAA